MRNQLAEMQADFAAQMRRLEPHPQTMVDEIRETAKRIGRWPTPPEDQGKPSWQVLAEYREIEESQKTSSKVRGVSS